MNVMRLNFSHGTYEYHQSVIDNLKASYAIWPGPEVAVALDTKGPEIRTGRTVNDADVPLVTGEELTLSTDKEWFDKGCATCIYVDYQNLSKVLKIGSFIYVDDGLIKLEVTAIAGTTVTTKIVNGGLISSRKGVNLPGTPVDLPSVSEKDKNDLRWAAERGIDFIFASFIRNAAAIQVRSVHYYNCVDVISYFE